MHAWFTKTVLFSSGGRSPDDTGTPRRDWPRRRYQVRGRRLDRVRAHRLARRVMPTCSATLHFFGSQTRPVVLRVSPPPQYTRSCISHAPTSSRRGVCTVRLAYRRTRVIGFNRARCPSRRRGAICRLVILSFSRRRIERRKKKDLYKRIIPARPAITSENISITSVRDFFR